MKRLNDPILKTIAEVVGWAIILGIGIAVVDFIIKTLSAT